MNAPLIEVLTDGPVTYRATWCVTPEMPMGASIEVATWDLKSFQVDGPLAPKGQLVLLGSNNGHDYVELETVTIPDILPCRIQTAFVNVRAHQLPAGAEVRLTLFGVRR